MARKRTKLAAVPKTAAVDTAAECGTSARGARKPSKRAAWSETFSRMACATAHWTGKPVAFLLAALAVIVWAVTGPLFGYSDTWQLVINTSTTIITFLMVFLIQNTQNRDTMALQLKLSELVLAVQGAENRLAAAEDLTDEELETLHKDLHRRAQSTLDTLTERREQRKKAS